VTSQLAPRAFGSIVAIVLVATGCGAGSHAAVGASDDQVAAYVEATRQVQAAADDLLPRATALQRLTTATQLDERRNGVRALLSRLDATYQPLERRAQSAAAATPDATLRRGWETLLQLLQARRLELGPAVSAFTSLDRYYAFACDLERRREGGVLQDSLYGNAIQAAKAVERQYGALTALHDATPMPAPQREPFYTAEAASACLTAITQGPATRLDAELSRTHPDPQRLLRSIRTITSASNTAAAFIDVGIPAETPGPLPAARRAMRNFVDVEARILDLVRKAVTGNAPADIATRLDAAPADEHSALQAMQRALAAAGISITIS
jgi:hypothetical protein